MQPQHPLASDARWGGTYRQNMKTLATIKDRIRTVKPDGQGVPGIAAIATPGHAGAHLGADRVRFQPASLCCRWSRSSSKVQDHTGSTVRSAGPCISSFTAARGIRKPYW
jgi:hypothetical protein